MGSVMEQTDNHVCGSSLKRRRALFDRIVSDNSDLVEKLDTLPRELKGARSYPESLIARLLEITEGFPLQWIGEAFGLQPCVVYRWRKRKHKADVNRTKPTKKATARRYTNSEKEAIAEACERLGTQVVHDEQGVSWDTITDVRAKRGKGPSTAKRRHHEIVIEIWRAHPGMGPMQVRD